MPLDQRFLSPHPRTLLWWQQRFECRQCAHYALVETGSREHYNSGTAEHCLLNHRQGASTAPVHSGACIDMRDPGQACGPEGRLFKERHDAA